MILDHEGIDAWCDYILEAIEGHDEDIVDSVGGDKTGLAKTAGLRAELHEARNRFETDRASGHRTNSIGGGAAPSRDVDGVPTPPYSDPTAAAVLSRDEQKGPIEKALEHGSTTIITAYRMLVTAQSKAAEAMRPPPEVTQQPEQIFCASHRRFDMNEPRALNGSRHCEWCAKFLQGFGQLPTERILDIRARGGRVTVEIIEKEIGRRTAKRKRRRAR